MDGKMHLALVGAMVVLVGASRSEGVNFGQVDDFQDGTVMYWAGGQGDPPLSVSSGGPEGENDGYLHISTPADFEYHLGVRNKTQWTGDYISAGITSIEMDLNHFSPITEEVSIRLLLFGPGGAYTSISPTPVEVDVWKRYGFGITEDDLVLVFDSGGTGDVTDTLYGVTTLLIRNDPFAEPTPIGGHPPHFDGMMGIDNITALPEPSSIGLLVLGGFLLRVKRRGWL